MESKPAKLKLHQPARYCICVQGALSESWADYFSGLTLVCDPNALPAGATILSGQVSDQAALLGVLNLLYTLALPLVSVEWLAERGRRPCAAGTGVKPIRDHVFKLTLEQFARFALKYAGVEGEVGSKPAVTDAQQSARSRNMAAARAARWKKEKQR